MKLEYLLNQEQYIEFGDSKLKIAHELYEIPGKNAYILSFSIPRDDEKSARTLSHIHKIVQEKIHGIVLTNGSSEYFVKTLFPHINEFETKLRKLLYLASALNKDNTVKGKENIKDLEKQELGTLFDLLFTDLEFNNKLRKLLGKEFSGNMSKRDVIQFIDRMDEKTLWNELLGSIVPGLSDKPNAIRYARNDIAHAHELDTNTFMDYKKLISGVNSQLDEAIYKFEGQTDGYKLMEDFNAILNSAILQSKRNSEMHYQIEGILEEYSVSDDTLLKSLSELIKSGNNYNIGRSLREYIRMQSQKDEESSNTTTKDDADVDKTKNEGD
ncbi:MAG: hypothetical protein AB9921_02450 [Erysipelotrichaceae bacterium]